MEMPEDDFTDILRKAMIGKALAPQELVRRAETNLQALKQFQSGQFDESLARKLANALDLNADAYAAIVTYRPHACVPSGILRLRLPFGEGHVNAWALEFDGQVVLFDTGYQARDLLKELEYHFRRLPDHVFVTHAHRDHIGGIHHLLELQIPTHAQGIKRATPIKPGNLIRIGHMTILAHDLAGHANAALGYSIEGLETPVMITGDALFAGSIGGCATPEAYRSALENIHQTFKEMPPNCIILPGHGPASTWGAELKHNAFIARKQA